MTIAWYLCPYKRDIAAERLGPIRYCAMRDLDDLIRADGGRWSETEVLGNMAVVKVNASTTTLDAIEATVGFYRLPKVTLADSLADLTLAQRNFINTRLLALGYSQADIDAASGGDWRTKTFEELLSLIASRRLAPRYDIGSDTITCNGPIQPVKSIRRVDAMVA